MGLPWIELHVGLPRHPKSIALGFALSNPMAWAHMAQLWLWCAECNPSGTFSGEHAEAMVESSASWMGKPGEFVAAAIKVGFLERTENGEIVSRGWQKRAAPHLEKRAKDSARQRERYKKLAPSTPKTSRGENAEKPRRKLGPHAENSGDKDKDKDSDSLLSEENRGPPVLLGRAEALRDLWNHDAHPLLPRWQGMSKPRRASADARIEEQAGFAYWREVIAKINASAFCRGENDRGWKASPDWLLQPDSASKVLEGKYDGRPRSNPNARATQGDRVDANYRPPLTADGELDLMGVGS